MHARFSRWLVAVAAVSSCLAIEHVARAEDPPKVPVKIDMDTPALEIFDQTDEVSMVPVYHRHRLAIERANNYKRLCTGTPCKTELTLGEHHLAISAPGGDLSDLDKPITITGPSQLTAVTQDRSAIRTAGAITIIGTFIAVPVLVAAAAETKDVPGPCSGGFCSTHTERGFDKTLMGTAVVVGVVGLLVGLGLCSQSDQLHWSVAPLSLGSAPGQRSEGMASAVPSGLELTWRF